MTIAQLSKAIGTQGVWAIGGVNVTVNVLDVRQAYGRIDYQIEPVSGTGCVWVSDSSLKLGEM